MSEIDRLRHENAELRRRLDERLSAGIEGAPSEGNVEVTRTQIVCVVCRKIRQLDIVPVQTDPGPALAFSRKHAAEHDGWILWPVPEDVDGMRCSSDCSPVRLCAVCERAFPEDEYPTGMPLSHGMEADPCTRSTPLAGGP